MLLPSHALNYHTRRVAIERGLTSLFNLSVYIDYKCHDNVLSLMVL